MTDELQDKIAAAAMTVAWDDWWDDELHRLISVDCCVLATRIAVKTLAALGVRAWPQPTQTTIYNRAAVELWQAGVPTEQWPEHAWSVGTATLPSGGYPGHLWAATDQVLIDLSARQFHRPGRLSFLRSVLIANEPDEHGNWVSVDATGQLIIARPITDRTYVNSPDWTANWRRFTPDLIERVSVASRTTVNRDG